MSVLAWMSTSWRLRLGVLCAMMPVMLAAVLALPSSVLLGLQVLSACLALVWLEAQVSRPLARIRQDAEQVACGEAPASDSLHRVDDIGMLARSIKQAGLNLKSLLDDVSHQVGGVRSASSEIAQGNWDLSARTEQSAASLQETAASMAQMNATVAGNAQRTSQVEVIARQAQQAVDAGTKEFDRLTATMGDMQRSSQRIADITALIDGIAFQTNILALNVAVEAARAGEQGRGFAVVAAEVRSLTQRSAAAAKDIRHLIEDSVERVTSGGALVGRVNRTMRDIAHQVTQVGGLIEEIGAATREQAQGISQVDVAVSQLDQSTQQNAALVEQSAAAANSLKSQSTRLADAVGAFRC
ncbi:MAG: aerotaxis receptor [Betaproteobacteria bacterium]|nr:aerotaxis receptor [Betaproteobacteria bacterium]